METEIDRASFVFVLDDIIFFEFRTRLLYTFNLLYEWCLKFFSHDVDKVLFDLDVFYKRTRERILSRI